jgi:hypothetical protein
MTKGEKWLESKTAKPEINIAGTWACPEWGIAMFKQEERQITGMLGDYPVKGVVSGNSIYLLMYSDERVDYFAELKASDMNIFKGFYSKYYTFDELRDRPDFIRPMKLQRIFTSP